MRTLVFLLLGASSALAAPETSEWSARLLDSAGLPVQGTPLVSLQLWNSETGGGMVGPAVSDTPDADNGYVSMDVSGLAAHLQANDPLWLEVTVDSTVVGPRQRLGAAPYAIVASRISSMSGAIPVTCSETGSIRWHTGSDTLQICTGSRWYEFQADATSGYPIVDNGGVREWEDGAVAISCDGYRNPPFGYQYSGVTGSGLYSVQPVGEPSALTVYCDMSTTEGWTLVSRIIGTSQLHESVGAVGTLTSPGQAAVAKLSDVTINRLRGDQSTSYVRFECGAGVTHFQENKPFNANGGGSLSLLRCSNAFPGTSWQASGGNGGHRGMNTNSTTCEYMIYSYDGEQALGCWQGGGDEKSGAVWVY